MARTLSVTHKLKHVAFFFSVDKVASESKAPRINGPAVEPRRRGAAGEPDGPVGVRRGAHRERRPRRLGLPQQRLAAEEGQRALPIPGERRDGGGGGGGGRDECHGSESLWRGSCCVAGGARAAGLRDLRGRGGRAPGRGLLIRGGIAGAAAWRHAARRISSSGSGTPDRADVEGAPGWELIKISGSRRIGCCHVGT